MPGVLGAFASQLISWCLNPHVGHALAAFTPEQGFILTPDYGLAYVITVPRRPGMTILLNNHPERETTL